MKKLICWLVFCGLLLTGCGNANTTQSENEEKAKEVELEFEDWGDAIVSFVNLPDSEDGELTNIRIYLNKFYGSDIASGVKANDVKIGIAGENGEYTYSYDLIYGEYDVTQYGEEDENGRRERIAYCAFDTENEPYYTEDDCSFVDTNYIDKLKEIYEDYLKEYNTSTDDLVDRIWEVEPEDLEE